MYQHFLKLWKGVRKLRVNVHMFLFLLAIFQQTSQVHHVSCIEDGALRQLYGARGSLPTDRECGFPNGQRRWQRVPVHLNCHVILRGLPLWHHAGLLSLQETREEKVERVHAPGARGGAAGVGLVSKKEEHHFPANLGTVRGAGVSAFLRG